MEGLEMEKTEDEERDETDEQVGRKEAELKEEESKDGAEGQKTSDDLCGVEAHTCNNNHYVDNNNKNYNNNEPIPSHFRSSAKKLLPKRDIRTLNYAFGKPKIDEAAQEAQDWLDSLSLADENDPPKPIFPHGLKYRSALANLSPQMLDRLQRCEDNQEPYEPPKNPRIRCGERNLSTDVHAGLHEEDHCNRPNNVWKGRRTAAGNSSSSVYAILHPQAEPRYKRKKSPKKKTAIKRNHLKEHLAAIAEMSSLTQRFKEKEREQGAERLSATKHLEDKEVPKKTATRQHNHKKTNFLEKNMADITQQSACVRALREDPTPDVLAPHKENIGRVPEYLQRIKTELAQEAEHRAIEEAAKSFPAGRRLMSEVNRRQILQKLENKHKELIDTLKSFPLMCDTPRQIRLKSNIEQQLRSIEASHSYYNNPKVYTSCLDINCPTCMCLNNHFSKDSQKKPSNSSDDLWEHMACAAGIQTSPKRNPSREAGGVIGNRGVLGAISLTKKRSQEGEFYVSPSKRQTHHHRSCSVNQPVHGPFARSVPLLGRQPLLHTLDRML